MEFNSRRTYFVGSPDGEAGSSKDESASVKLADNSLIVPVILSGGGGSRLWPFSTQETPKQFLPLINGKSLFEQALDRVRGRAGFSAPIVVGSAQHADLCEKLLAVDGSEARLILEPCARNTAPAVVMAASIVSGLYGEDALILVMPSDHVIEDIEEFHQAVTTGQAAARAGRLVTFGVRPTGPDTGYGYLQAGRNLAEAPGVQDVVRFVEKPGLDAAERMLAGGDHLWNAGIFLFQAKALLTEAARSCQSIADAAIRAVTTAERKGIRVLPNAEALAGCPSESIDYAVMEHASRVAVVPMSPGWSDLGSWDALAAVLEGAAPEGPVTTVDCESCYIRSDGVQVAALGVRDLIIVASGGRLLILPRGRSQEVKRLLSAMDSMAA